VIGRDRLRNVLQQHRLTRARRRNDETALAFADGRHQVHDTGGDVVPTGLKLETFLRIERRQVFEEEFVARLVGRFEVNGLNLDEREITLAVFRRPDLAGDGVAGLEVELANL